MDLFSFALDQNDSLRPLSDVLRPDSFDYFLLAQNIKGPLDVIIKMIQSKVQIPSLILWGPPGTGKTSLAQCLSQNVDCFFSNVNAVDIGTKDLKQMGEKAKSDFQIHQKPTLIFIDEIHRLNKSQQDVLLPFVEKGYVILIGATTEHPGYEINSALLSRCRLLQFERHSDQHLKNIIEACFKYAQLPLEKIITVGAQAYLIQLADGDARKLINSLDLIFKIYKTESSSINWPLPENKADEWLNHHILPHDKKGESHYNLISALIKSLRGSNADAALYYLARLVKSGEEPTFIARRLIVFASEDIGNADPRALGIAVDCFQAVQIIGFPEAGINLAQAVTFLATCSKSNRSYVGYKKALEYVEQTGSMPVPMHLQNNPSNKNKDSKKYKYPHDFPKNFVEQKYFPEEVSAEPEFYEPSASGYEKHIQEFLKWLKN